VGNNLVIMLGISKNLNQYFPALLLKCCRGNVLCDKLLIIVTISIKAKFVFFLYYLKYIYVLKES